MEIRTTVFPQGSSGAGKTYDVACAPLQAVVLLSFEGYDQQFVCISVIILTPTNPRFTVDNIQAQGRGVALAGGPRGAHAPDRGGP